MQFSVDPSALVINADNVWLLCLAVFVLKFHVSNAEERGEYLKFCCKMQNVQRVTDGFDKTSFISEAITDALVCWLVGHGTSVCHIPM